MIIQADEHVILIARTVDLEGSAWEGFGSSRRFCKSITPSTPKGHVPTSDKATNPTTACSHILVPKFSLCTNLAKKALDLCNQKIWPNFQKFSLLKVWTMCVFTLHHIFNVDYFGRKNKCYSKPWNILSLSLLFSFAQQLEPPVQNLHSGIFREELDFGVNLRCTFYSSFKYFLF